MFGTSIVIATADRPFIVADCLTWVRQQLPADVEVVVVDSGIESPVNEQALKVLWPNLRVVRSSVRNAGTQRNLGVQEARGEIIVFLDDDTFIQPGWWPGIVAPLCDDRLQTIDYRLQTGERRAEGGNLRPESEGRDKRSEVGGDSYSQSGAATPIPRHTHTPTPHSLGIAAVAGAVWCNPSPTFTDKRGGYINWRGEPIQVTHRSAKAPRDVDWPMTTNMAVRKDVFLAVGGFSEVYGIYDEDVDFGLKLRKAGWGIRFVPEAAVYHYYLKRPRRTPTKQFIFTLGRNRSILLVRHYGISSKLLFFLLTEPWIRLWDAAGEVARTCVRAFGHVVAHGGGMLAGIVVGYKNPVDRVKR
jgi:GT2 family glycosyltransferase